MLLAEQSNPPRNRFADVGGLTPDEWLAYANQGATRNLPLAQDLVEAMSFLPELGLRMEVFSGGQPAAGQGPRVGSTRHDHGNAADVFFVDASGRRLDWSNPQDVPTYQEIVRRAREAGVTGFGAGPGYMQPGSMHIGFGPEAVWGADGSGANAPDWLREAFGGASAPTVARAQTQQPQGGQTMPQGLLSPNVSSMNTQEPSIWDALVGRLPESVQPIARRTIGDADWRDRMAIALAGMSTRPNQAIIGTLQDRMESRDEDRRMNQTVAYLESIGRPDLAAAIAAGLPAGDAIGAALAPAPPPPVPVTINGQLVDPTTGQVIGDYRDQTGQTREMREDQNGVLRYVDDGTEVFAGVQTQTAPTDPTDLRTEWNRLPQVQDFADRSAAFRNVVASAQNPSPAGDVSLIYNYMKMLDPGSSIQQGEIALAQDAGSLPNQLVAQYNAVINGQALAPDQRKDFLDRAAELYQTQEQGYLRIRSQYENTAREAGLDPDAALTDYRYFAEGQVPFVREAPAARPTTTAPAPAGNSPVTIPPSLLQNQSFVELAQRRNMTPEEYFQSLPPEKQQELLGVFQ